MSGDRTSLDDGHAPQASDGLFHATGNSRHVFERRTTPLCFTQPYYNPLVYGPLKVPNEPMRMTPALREVRGDEVVAFGARRVKEIRRLPDEFKTKIKEAADRDKAIEAEKNKNLPRLRWWHTRQSVEVRDLLKTLKFNNATFRPEALLNAKDVVILNLTGCALGDEAMIWVSTFMQQNTTLRRVNLSGNRLTVQGMRNIRPGFKCHSLIDFDVSLNPIGDSGLNEIVSGLSENIRHTKIARLNVSTCDLSSSSGYHMARLIRDFKTLDAIFAWRNRIGDVRDVEELSGVGLIFEELALTKTLKHIDLSANCVSEEICLKHATLMEQLARQRRLAAIEKTTRAARIDAMTKQITDMKSQELWEDERVILAGLERELVQEKVRYRQQQEEDVRSKKQKTKDFEWIQRVQELTGRELCDSKVQVRLVLMGNHSVTPMTVSRLAQFYDLNSKDDTQDWLTRERRFDHIVVPRRQPGQEYEFLDEEASSASRHNVFAYEAEMLAKEMAEKEKRAREMDDIRRRGGDGDRLASTVLEERLRGRSSQRSRTPRASSADPSANSATTPFEKSIGFSNSNLRAGENAATVLDAGAASTTLRLNVPSESHLGVGGGGGGRSPRRRDVQIVGEDDAERSRGGRTPRGGSRTPRRDGGRHTPRTPRDGQLTPRDGRGSGGSTPGKPPSIHDAAEDAAILTEQSDAELFSDAAESVHSRADAGHQRRTTRRVATRSVGRSGNAKATVGLSIASPVSPRDDKRGGGGDTDFAVAEGDDVEAFGDDVFEGTMGGGGDSDMQALFSRLIPKNDLNTSSGMQRKLDARMDEIRERIAAKVETAKADAQPPTELAQSLRDDAGDAAVEVRAHHETGEVTIVMKNSNSMSAASPDAGEMSMSVKDVPNEVDPFVVAKALLADGLSTLQTFWSNITALSEIGSPTEDDLELLEAERTKCARFKASLAEQLFELGLRVPVTAADKVEALALFAEELVKETDRREGTTALLRALFECVEADWPSIIDSRALGAMAACDGSIELLRAMLNVPDVRFDVPEVVCSAFFNQGVRIPLARLLLQHAQDLHLGDYADDLQSTWQEFFEDVASKKRAIPREEREGRLELLDAMLKFNDLPIDAMIEGPDHQSLFSRACIEGDLDVVQLLISNDKVQDINAVRSDGMTALHSAVIGNNPDLVQYLLNAPSIGQDIDVTIASNEGNPLDLAVLLMRDGRICSMLKERGGTQSSKSAGKKAKPKGKAGVAVGAAASKLASRVRRK